MTDFAQARIAMVDCQVRPSDVTNYAIIEALLSVPREVFVPKSRRDVAYAESDIDLGEGRSLLAPRTFAKMLEAAAIDSDDLVLDLGAGTGYGTAVLSRIAGAVVAREWEPALASKLEANVAELELDNAVLSTAAEGIGDADNGPYDVIMVSCGVEEIGDDLVSQLKDGGRLVAVMMDGSMGHCRVKVRSGDHVSDRYVFDATAQVPELFRKTEEFAL